MKNKRIASVLLNQDPSIRISYVCPACNSKYSNLPQAVNCVIDHSKKETSTLPIVDRMFSDYLTGKNSKNSYVPIEIFLVSRVEPLLVKNPVQLHRELNKYWEESLPTPVLWVALEILLAVVIAVIMGLAANTYGLSKNYAGASIEVGVTLAYWAYATKWRGLKGGVLILPIRPALLIPIQVAIVIGFFSGLATGGGAAG